MPDRKLVLIDGFSLLFRAFYANPYMSTSDGRPTNALYGFVSMLFRVLEKERPTAVVVALDSPTKTFRHAEFVAYKGTRKEPEEALTVQLAAAGDFIRALQIPAIEAPGYEADDIIGTLSHMAADNGFFTQIVTGDLDSLQLVNENVSVLTPKKGSPDPFVYTPAEVMERLGVGPELVTDFKGLKGDTSDNIPGVAGIGDKGAAYLLQTYGTVEMILEQLDKIEPKYRAKIEPQIDQMKLSKWLATIVKDVSVVYDFAPLVITNDELAQTKSLLETYEFKSLVNRCGKVFAPYLEGAAPREESEPETVETVETDLAPIEINLVETSELAVIEEKIGRGGYAVIVPPSVQTALFDAQESPAFIAFGKHVWQVPASLALDYFRAHPERGIVHDGKPLYKSRGSSPMEQPPRHDTLLSGFVLQSGRGKYALADLIQGYLDVQPPASLGQAASALFHLAPVLEARLEKEGQTRVFKELEMPLIPVLAKMESLGICADRSHLREFSQKLQVEIESVQAKIHALAGREFLIGSPKQLGEVLFDEMKLPGAQKTKTGYATGVEVLGELAGEYPIVAEVLSWRELSKLKSTYADSLERLVQEDGRIHTTYNQTGAATGRLSSIDPNLQNIPIRTELGRPIRQAFHAGSGYKLVSIDYSQIELRVLAHLCEEPALVSAFQNHEDVHSVTAPRIFGLGDQKPDKNPRRTAKMLNYAVLYGVTEFGLAQQLGAGFSVAEARELIRQYNERFPSVHDFTQSIVKEAKSKGFTTTMLGRRRYFPDIHAARVNDRRYAERQAMNAPIQGSAADMLKLAMIHVHQLLEGTGVRMLLTVHDELVFEVPEHESHDILNQVAGAMSQAMPLNVPVEVDGKIGPNWNEMKEVSLSY